MSLQRCIGLSLSALASPRLDAGVEGGLEHRERRYRLVVLRATPGLHSTLDIQT